MTWMMMLLLLNQEESSFLPGSYFGDDSTRMIYHQTDPVDDGSGSGGHASSTFSPDIIGLVVVNFFPKKRKKSTCYVKIHC